jgi:hypothetical protein
MSRSFFITCFAATLVALATIAPVANAAGSRTHECQPSPAHWVSVTDDLGVPNLELVGGTTCTTAVTTTESCAAQRSPYPGWVQVIDESGLPMLYKIGFEPTTFTPCSETSVAQSTSALPTVTPSPVFTWPPLKSPYAGWVFVYDDQGVPYLEAISEYR